MTPFESKRFLILPSPCDNLTPPQSPRTPEQLRMRYFQLEQNLDELWSMKKHPFGKIPKGINDNVKGAFQDSIPNYITLNQVAYQYLLPLFDQHNKIYADHSRRTAGIAHGLVFDYGLKNPDQAFTLKQLRDLYYAALLHDIGKIIIPNSILDSSNGRSQKEVQIARHHVHFTRLILSLIPQTRHLASIGSFHHERADGKGYYRTHPHDIPLSVQFIILADYFDSITQNRVYHCAESGSQAHSQMLKETGLLIPAILDYIDHGKNVFEMLGAELPSL
jgi:HD-GYP domain-containing protein (c-di-GMP phosphodiesterase class II)